MPADKKKICMIVPEREVKGGIASVVSRYYESSLNDEYMVTYLTSYRDGTKVQKLGKALSCYRAFQKLLRTDPPDLVHVHSSFGPSFYRKLPLIRMAKKKGIPVVNHIHGSDLEGLYYGRGEARRNLIRETYEGCDRLIVLSDHWKEELLKIAPKADIRVISNYGETHPEMLSEEVQEKRRDRKQVLYLGMIVPEKGADLFPQVITKVKEKAPEAHFLLGGIGDISLLLQNIPEAFRDSVSCPGWITGEEKEKALRGSAVFLFPSQMEAFPMAVLEAMGYGLPVVTTRTGGIPDLVEENGNAVLTDVRDAEAMAEGILAFLTNEERRRAFGERSLLRVQETFSFEEHLEKLKGVYREILG